MRIHELKTWKEFFWNIETGKKNFEVRKNDRDFHNGDVLHLKEIDKHTKEYTGKSCLREITYILDAQGEFGIEKGVVILSLKEIGKGNY